MTASGDPITKGEFATALDGLRQDIRTVYTILGDMRERMASIESTCKASSCIRLADRKEIGALQDEMRSVRLFMAKRKGAEGVVVWIVAAGASVLSAVITSLIVGVLS